MSEPDWQKAIYEQPLVVATEALLLSESCKGSPNSPILTPYKNTKL